MSFNKRRSLLKKADKSALQYAGIFVLCASMSALGAGPLAVGSVAAVAGAAKLFSDKERNES